MRASPNKISVLNILNLSLLSTGRLLSAFDSIKARPQIKNKNIILRTKKPAFSAGLGLWKVYLFSVTFPQTKTDLVCKPGKIKIGLVVGYFFHTT